jgi:hypothetical protein
MKTPTPRKIVVLSLLAFGAVLAASVARADEKSDAAAERKAQREAEILKKYDVNHDGKLDDNEKAARKADRDKAKAEREAKKREREEKKNEPDRE